jgi:hypothetical protein
MIFVFGSNTAGIHGAGAAKFALKNHGAVWGQGVGLQGNSYAIPTKDDNIRTLPLVAIEQYIRQFLQFASANPSLQFQVTRVGCGLAGYIDDQIAPYFKGAPSNCFMPPEWVSLIGGTSW